MLTCVIYIASHIVHFVGPSRPFPHRHWSQDVLQRSDDNVLSHGWVYNSEEVLGPLLRTLFDLGLTPDEVRRMILAQPTLIR